MSRGTGPDEGDVTVVCDPTTPAARACRDADVTEPADPPDPLGGLPADGLLERCARLSTAHLADGCLRAGVPVAAGPAGMRPLQAGTRVVGRALPARHSGSVDVFLEALEGAGPGDVLVVDDGGRLDRSCVGDLVALECAAAGLGGLVVWGLHRDTAELRAAGLPVFSLGAVPNGPERPDPRPPDALRRAMLGRHAVHAGDLVAADDDGVLVVPRDAVRSVVARAEEVRDTERRQAELLRAGRTLRAQLGFADYLATRARRPSVTFREHLRAVGGAVEE